MSEVSYKALGDAVERLRRAVGLMDVHRDDDLYGSMRDSVLLSFQFTFGLCRPMLERFLVSVGDDPQEVDELSYAALVRSANERGVLRVEWEVWKVFRDARNRMAHVYSEVVADEILGHVPGFLEEAAELSRRLQARSAEL